MSRWSDTVDLITKTNTTDKYGDTISTEITTTVYANKLSIRQSEFYQAQSIGLKPEVAFEVRSFEYNGQGNLKFNNKEYSIVRTYDKGEFIELICEGVVNDGNA